MEIFIEQLKPIDPETEKGKSTVVIVDDDKGFSLMLKEYLYSSAELKADLFTNGDDFLKEYTAKDNRKIILDYDFNNHSNGLEILKKIKKVNSAAIVIMVSSQDNLEVAVETFRNGASDYFLKNKQDCFYKYTELAGKDYEDGEI